MSIFDLSGPEFLQFYFWAFLVALFFVFAVPHLLRLPADLPRHIGDGLHPFEIAYLKKGARGVFQSAMVSLYHRGLITVDSYGAIAAREFRGATGDFHAVERYLLERVEIRNTVANIYDTPLPADVFSRFRLLDRRLILSAFHREMVRLISTLAPAVLLLAAMYKMVLGVSREKPVGYLMLWIIATAAITVYAFTKCPRRTWRGDQFLTEYAKTNAALQFVGRRKPEDMAPIDAALSTALFGVAAGAFGSTLALALDPPAERSSWLTRSIGDCSSGGSSCSSCGGGGGGGGCGGCGGGH